MNAMLVIHLAITWALVGLIWCVQILIYPQFPHFSAEKFRQCHFYHCFRIALIVVPLMVLEVITAGALLWQGMRGQPFLISVGLIPLVWISTALWQAPAHLGLMAGFDGPRIRRLILTNWVRTAVWTVRGILVSLAAL